MSEEMRKGYLYSFLSPVLVSALAGGYSGISEAIHGSIWVAPQSFFYVFILSLTVSTVASAIFCFVVGLPVYYLLRKLSIANVYTITFTGLLVAYLFSLGEGQNAFITTLILFYGGASAFFFWLGSTRVSV